MILRKSVPDLSEAELARFVLRAERTLGLQGVVNVLVTTSRELRALNSRFRGKNMPTDVLSFAPMPGMVTGLAGDIAISAEIAAQNAKHLKHSSADEVRILALHGILHLAGYDHESDEGVMARKEIRLRKLLGLPSGLLERNGMQPVISRRKPRPSPKSKAGTALKR